MPEPTPFHVANLLAGTWCYIYTLHASNDPECRPRYVGFTTRLKRREIEHNTGRKSREGRKGEWVRALLSIGEHAILKAVYSFRSNDVTERGIIEGGWVKLHQEKYPDLLNDADGGYGLALCSLHLRAKRKVMNLGRKHSLETRKKVSLSKLGKKRPPHVIEILRKANLGRKQSAEQCAKRSQRMKGTTHSPEARAKISAANKGRKRPPELVARLAEKLRGRKLSPEHRAKIALAGIGRKASPETCAKRSALLRGKKRTPESRERCRQAAILRWLKPEERENQSNVQKLRFARERGKV